MALIYKGQLPIAVGITVPIVVAMTATYIIIRKRISFSVLVIEHSLETMKEHGSIYLLAMLQLLGTLVWLAIWCVASIGIHVKLFTKSMTIGDLRSATGSKIFVYTFFTFGAYWVAQVIGSVLHASVAGLYRQLYLPWENGASKIVKTPTETHTIWSSYKRAMGKSFGTICFASLLVPVFQFSKLYTRPNPSRGAIGGIVSPPSCVNTNASLNGCSLAYATTHDKAFCEAASDTSSLLRRRGLEVVLNESIIHIVLAAGALLVGGFTSGIGGLYVGRSLQIQSEWMAWTGDARGDYEITIIAVVVGLIIGLTTFGLTSSLISGGVSAMLVCIAEDPQSLAVEKPDLLKAIQQKYPEVNYRSI
ncbi:putative choline transporter, neither null mutation nor overexpression affects choline transport [Gonapodya sp. JEL0774]|nr:putative choline transporter, neither null mutation nor overexpression affects choline transport [Gonapodya sp. JEL0774]